MIDLPRQELWRLIYVLALGSGLGWLAGSASWGLCGGLLAYIFFYLRNLQKLYRWLKENPEGEVPDASGLWDDIFHSIYRLQSGERRARETLLNIIGRARASVSALHEAVVLIDANGNLEWWNPAAESLLGLKSRTDIGQPVTNLIRDPAFVRYFEQGPYEDGLQMPSFVNPGRHLQIELTAFGGNDRLMIVYDVSRLHNLEQMRKDFVANVSHELRTPLTVLTGYLETLLGNAEQISPRWLRALQQMEQQAGRMTNLVNDLLLLSRLENDPVQPEARPVSVAVLLQQIRNEATAYGLEKHHSITLEADNDLRILGFENDLRSAFSNLVTNAVKYTPPNGKIAIRWWADDNGAYLSVRDNGLGIERKHLPRLTERFYRADAARSTATGGTGLGLAIVKHVLLQHKATLRIESDLGKGSCFTCVFPEAIILP